MKRKKIYRNKNSKSPAASNFAPPGVGVFIKALDGKGDTIPAQTRQFFEPKMNHHFGEVKIHTGSDAAASAEAINAKAYTHGKHIVFNEGQYQPGTSDGKKLLAHELTHVVQQSKSVQPQLIQRALLTHPTVADPNFVFEAEAKLYAFSDLASMFGSTSDAIAKANPSIKASAIHVGDHIKIPAVNYPGGNAAPSGTQQPGIVVVSDTKGVEVRWNSGTGSNKIGSAVRGKPISVVGNGCWIKIGDLNSPASGIIAELTSLGLATATDAYGYIDAANQRLVSAAISTADQDTLARMIWGEQRGQGHDAMVAAAWIVMNRYKGGWGTIGQILTASGQFQGLVGSAAVQNLSGKELELWTDAKTIAAGVIGGTIADTTSGYKFFGNGADMKAKMDTCAKSSSAFKYSVIAGTNFYYSNGDYTGSCKVE